MADSGSVLKFPVGKSAKAEVSIPFQGTPAPKIDSYDYDETVNLYQIATAAKKKAEDLVTFVDQNRPVARQAGIEVLAVQLNSILEGEKFQRVMDALEDAVYRRVPVSLTQDGTDKIHRMERLVADADSVIVNFMNGKKVEPAMGQSFAPYAVLGQSSSDIGTWMPVVIIGIAGIVGVIAIIALSNNRPREVVEVPVPSKPKSRKP